MRAAYYYVASTSTVVLVCQIAKCQHEQVKSERGPKASQERRRYSCREATAYLSRYDAMTTSPSLSWSFDLPNVSGRISSSALLRKGNAVVSTRDGQHLYITTDDGTLSIVALRNGASHGTLLAEGGWQDETGLGGVADIISFQPPAIEGRHMDCRSGVSLHETDDGAKFAVYAVSDVPIAQNRAMTYNVETGEMTFMASGVEGEDDVKSRVLAVNSDGTLRWEVALAGYVEGTPLIGQADPTKIFVSLNVPDAAVQNVFDPDFYRGRVVVINEADDGDVAVTASKETQQVPFGPLALRVVKVRGERRDIVFVTENRGKGHVPAGGIYVLNPSTEHDLRRGRGDGAYELRTLSRWLRSSIARCVVSENGNSLWASGTGSRLAGFDLGSFVTSVGEKEIIEATWEATTSASYRNDTQRKFLTCLIVWPTINHSPDSPFLSISIFRVRLILLIAALRAAGALSDDGASIFVAGGSSTFHSINAMTGDVQWSDNNGESLYISEPKISKITQGIVYAIEVRLICPSLLLVFLSFHFLAAVAPLPTHCFAPFSLRLIYLACKWKGGCLQPYHRNPAMGI